MKYKVTIIGNKDFVYDQLNELIDKMKNIDFSLVELEVKVLSVEKGHFTYEQV